MRQLVTMGICRNRRVSVFALLFLALMQDAVFAANNNALQRQLDLLGHDLGKETGIYVLEYGEQSLIGRAWLARNAQKSIDVQYFIWSSDNVGTLAAEALLRAADRGVKIRVIVDDLMIDVSSNIMLALAAHLNVQIRIYNPKHKVGVGFFRRLANLVSDFRGSNQRMHDKTVIVDGTVGVTGGRNMADEYYDFDKKYNFRDRDALVIGRAAGDMQKNFDRFWRSKEVMSVERLLPQPLAKSEVDAVWKYLHQYAKNPENFQLKVKAAIDVLSGRFDQLRQNIVWAETDFVRDYPGKNEGKTGLGGGGDSTRALIKTLDSAKSQITIQSPYLVLPKGGLEFFRNKVSQGVKVRIITNSLASTDNLYAFSGYKKNRTNLLQAGVELYEFKPHPEIEAELIERYPELKEKAPIFSLHAKTFVVDSAITYIGTFNLDPRSANLNTEVGVLVKSRRLAKQVEAAIEKDMLPGNSWRISKDNRPDAEETLGKRFRLFLLGLLPLDPLL